MIDSLPTHPAPVSAEIQAAIDREHLRILEIVFYIAGGVTALFSCVFLIHFTMFLMFGLNPQMFANTAHNGSPLIAPARPVQPPPAGFFLVGAAVIGIIILIGWAFGAVQIYAGRCLRHRRHRVFVMIVSGFECIFIPWGTAIGVCTLMALSRPSLKSLFHGT